MTARELLTNMISAGTRAVKAIDRGGDPRPALMQADSYITDARVELLIPREHHRRTLSAHERGEIASRLRCFCIAGYITDAELRTILSRLPPATPRGRDGGAPAGPTTHAPTVPAPGAREAAREAHE